MTTWQQQTERRTFDGNQMYNFYAFMLLFPKTNILLFSRLPISYARILVEISLV